MGMTKDRDGPCGLGGGRGLRRLGDGGFRKLKASGSGKLRDGRGSRKLKDKRGQMTVELCVVFPVVIAIAVIATNAMSFFGSCAEFDRVGRNAVRTFAAAPEHGQDAEGASAKVLASIESALPEDNLDVEVSTSTDYRGYVEYTMTLRFHPTLFGMGLKQEVFGVPLPALTHESRLTVNPYKPGMLF